MIEKQSLDLLKTLIGFDTTSFKSNLNLIKFIENYLNQYKIKSELVYDETKNKANLFATIGPNSSGGLFFLVTPMLFQLLTKNGTVTLFN